jgi:lipoate-protein ligase A
VSVLASAAGEDSDALAESLRSRVASLSEALGRPVGADEARVALLAAMRALGISLVADTLTPAEATDAERLNALKYGDPTWTYRR